MVKLIISNITKNAFSNADGELVYSEIKKALLNGEAIKVSFFGFTSVNSSFINSALVQLLNDFSMTEIKKRLMFVDTTKQIDHMILTRFKFAEEKKLQTT